MKFPPAFIKDTPQINVIIETPKGCGNKFTFDPETELFKLGKTLPEGLVFPLHFGFIPGTKGEDGDPLDALVMMDEGSFPGTLIECKVLGVIEARQEEKGGKEVRNDRVIAAALGSRSYSNINSINDLSKYFTEELSHFFITYNGIKNKKFTPLAHSGPKKAIALIKKHLVK